jgi:hypothetical protein
MIENHSNNMETGKLYIRKNETGKPEVIFEPVEGMVWMNVNQIAKLLGCFPVTISNHLRAVMKSGVLWESDVCRLYRYYTNSKTYPECEGVLCNLDVVIALAYWIKSYQSEIIRKWLLKRICAVQSSAPVQFDFYSKIILN